MLVGGSRKDEDRLVTFPQLMSCREFPSVLVFVAQWERHWPVKTAQLCFFGTSPNLEEYFWNSQTYKNWRTESSSVDLIFYF